MNDDVDVQGVYHAYPVAYPLPQVVQERLRNEKAEAEHLEKKRAELGMKNQLELEAKASLKEAMVEKNERLRREQIVKRERHAAHLTPKGARMVLTMPHDEAGSGCLSMAFPPPEGLKVYLMPNDVGRPSHGPRVNGFLTIKPEERPQTGGWFGLAAPAPPEGEEGGAALPTTTKYFLQDAHASFLAGGGGAPNVVEVENEPQVPRNQKPPPPTRRRGPMMAYIRYVGVWESRLVRRPPWISSKQDANTLARLSLSIGKARLHKGRRLPGGQVSYQVELSPGMMRSYAIPGFDIQADRVKRTLRFLAKEIKRDSDNQDMDPQTLALMTPDLHMSEWHFQVFSCPPTALCELTMAMVSGKGLNDSCENCGAAWVSTIKK